jgi:hypothetical protein
MADSGEPDIRWSRNGSVHIAVVERRMVAVVYWSKDDKTWRWVAADRPSEHFLVTHAEPREDALGVTFTAEAVLRAYLAGADPLEASEMKSYLQEQSD